MINNKLKDNSLIKRKNLYLELKKKGIERTSPKAISKIEKEIKEHLSSLFTIAKQEMMMNGRKNLKEEDINSASKLISSSYNNAENSSDLEI